MSVLKWLPWITDNRNHSWTRGPLYMAWEDGLVGVQVREQGGYGVIDLDVGSGTAGDPDVEWLPWLARNEDHDWERPAFKVPTGYMLVGLEVKQQGGYGIVDVRCVCKDAQGGVLYSDWFCDNPNGDVISCVCKNAKEAVVGIQAREQGGYGIIDIRLAYVQLP